VRDEAYGKRWEGEEKKQENETHHHSVEVWQVRYLIR
jgi:hypothetical protein